MVVWAVLKRGYCHYDRGVCVTSVQEAATWQLPAKVAVRILSSL